MKTKQKLSPATTPTPAQELKRVREEMASTINGTVDYWKGQYSKFGAEAARDPLLAIEQLGEATIECGCFLRLTQWLAEGVNGTSPHFTEEQFEGQLRDRERELTHQLLTRTDWGRRSTSAICDIVTTADWKGRQKLLMMVRAVIWWRKRITELDQLAAEGAEMVKELPNPHAKW